MTIQSSDRKMSFTPIPNLLFSNLTYYKQGGSKDGEERFKAYFAVNANKRLGFGFNIDYVYGRGKYMNQSTALFNGNLFCLLSWRQV